MESNNQIDTTTIQTFSDRLRGSVLQQGDEDYDEARSVWNGKIDREPMLIARCKGTADVMAAVDFAREHDILVSVKGGGHNIAGKAVCDGGLMIDLSPMDSIRVDPEEKVARVGPGATWGDVYHETQAFGLATAGGTVSTVGVAGLTLGGGLGHLSRSFGLACDNLVGADVVTAEGELVRASADENPDLFWGLRGGGGNFGIVTSFEYELHEVGPEVLTAQTFYPYEDTEEVLHFYRDFMAETPDEVSCYCVIDTIPPEPSFPEEYHGQKAIGVLAAYFGDVEEGYDVLEPLQDVSDPLLERVQPMPFTVLNSLYDHLAPAGGRYDWRTHYVEDLSDEAIDTTVELTESLPGEFTHIAVEPMGGAINRVDSSATAYPHRDAAFTFGIFSGWHDPERDDEISRWTREFHEAMAPYSMEGQYANYVSEDVDEKIEAIYGDNYDRLVEVKNEWDPDNFFQQNWNVEPTS